MKSVRCFGGAVEVVEVPAPVHDGVRVRIRSAGICGSDLHLIAGGIDLPHTLGHELAGVLADGREVAIEPLVPCGECDLCATDAYNLCRAGAGMILGIGLDGGMAEEIVVPERCLVPLARGVSARCLVEPLAIAVHGLRAVDLCAEDRVAVVGAGTIGLCAVAYAAGIAAEVGLHARHDAQAEVGERLAARPIEGEYDLVIECAGSASGIRRAVGLCRPGGRLLLLATYWSGLELPAFELALKEIRVTPSSLYAVQRDRRDIDLA
ncbi:MAG: alcohol dehydrogenase catalytic domain-containing protein, partial [Deltaproteobacteria bacterium]|nr:alcohol dehydrogenase catalytic domain-containing protein [Deltaproteobacteria bacterium]